MSKASHRVYIDESGDEGFSFRDGAADNGSSDWFVLTAFVTRTANDLQTVKIIDTVRDEFGLHPKKHVHWKKLKHPLKVRYAQMIAGLPARAISICVHKPSLLEPEKFRLRYGLYLYCVRYMLERVSWLVRDTHNPDKYGGDGTADILFSNRSGMSYEEMKDYLRRLELMKEHGQDIRIDFDHVKIDQISALSPGRAMGLQLADAVAGATFNALERDPYENTEPRYIQTLDPIMYKNRGMLWGYGLKVVPREAMADIADQSCCDWLRDKAKT
ncbi:MAG TPA: DUF3800 domain-containing protein [Bacteroidetes bacterium]|nr:hypothetical protein BMS3Bbin04_01925 [bacterium BMS3Bbin04]HDO65048.1 DUF3800 domain-containing protein [Bacteroidota bacterium]HEX04173.1 DUF3800 domain-containing protein [Bacteroidota bacterium]